MRYLNSDASLENPITLIGRRLQVHFIYTSYPLFDFLEISFFFFVRTSIIPFIITLSYRNLIFSILEFHVKMIFLFLSAITSLVLIN